MDGLVAYDVLDNERRKAVSALRRWKPEKAINNDHCGEIQIRLLYQILDLGGAMMMDGADAAKKVRDRLIHLLGGDQPSGIDVLRAMDAESDDDGTCPNDDTTSSITHELRDWMSTVLTSDDYAWAIADRIDAQFDRICAQQEAVLQETIDRMADENLTAKDERDHWKRESSELRAKMAIIRETIDG